MRSIFFKVMWVGRATVFTVGLAITLALMLGVATVALAAVPGDPFRLGRINTINSLSTLVGSVSTPMLRIDNNGNGAALDLQVEPGKTPMKVNSGTKVANLNSDTVDGKSSADFYAAGSKVADATRADKADTAASAQNAANSDTLDGKDSTAFALADHRHATQIKVFTGPISNNLVADSQWRFAGPTTTVTVANGQRITGSAQAPLGLTSGSPSPVSYALCLQATTAGSPVGYLNSFSAAEVSTTRIPFASNATVAVGNAGATYNIGFCVSTLDTGVATVALNDNDWVNGWVMVTND